MLSPIQLQHMQVLFVSFFLLPNSFVFVKESEKLVSVEVWEDEPYERTEIQKVIEDRKVPQVNVFERDATSTDSFIRPSSGMKVNSIMN